MRHNWRVRVKYAMASLNGQAEFVLLGELHRVAERRYGFEGTMKDAAILLEEMRDVRLERCEILEHTRVFASAYWSLDGVPQSNGKKSRRYAKCDGGARWCATFAGLRDGICRVFRGY